MNITVNNKPTTTEASTLAQLADALALPAVGVAVAINNKMVPRTEWSSKMLCEGDSVVIIKAVCGG